MSAKSSVSKRANPKAKSLRDKGPDSGAKEFAGKPAPYVKPGRQLRFMEKIKAQGCWPPRGKDADHGREKGPTITPYIIAPCNSGDGGARPIPSLQANFSKSIEVIDPMGIPVLEPRAGTGYTLRCHVVNHGGAGAFGGIAEFYVSNPQSFNTAAATTGAVLPMNGLAGFSVLPGKSVVVDCPKKWIPVSDAEAASSILVQAYDVFADKVVGRFDARNDRHVARRDHIADFSGVWDGMESANPLHGVPTLERIVIVQNYLDVQVGFYSQLGGGIPAQPQDSGTGTIVNNQIQISTTEYWGPSQTPFTSNQWMLSLTSGGLIHFTHHRHYLMPGDGRPDTDTFGDLHRT